MRRYAVDEWHLFDGAGRRKYVNADERLRFLRSADRLPPEARALCYLIAFTGCRLSEAIALRQEGVDRSLGLVFFKTLKRRRTAFRAVPVPDLLMQMLWELPPRADGRLWHVHRTTAWRWVRSAMTDARIAGAMCCPKGLRHGFGVRAAGKSVPVNLIQRWMGHASPETTAIYLDVVGEEERRIAERIF